MNPTRKTRTLALVATAALLGSALSPAPAQPPREGISLLQTLAGWQYPGSTLLGGAGMSDGGNPEIQDVICQAVLTTPDPVDAVARYYESRPPVVPGATSTQDDSKARPVAVRVITVHRADTSTTLAISRAEGEKETHIAWLHYIRIPPPRPAPGG